MTSPSTDAIINITFFENGPQFPQPVALHLTVVNHPTPRLVQAKIIFRINPNGFYWLPAGFQRAGSQ
jgi:hypothetical protein